MKKFISYGKPYWLFFLLAPVMTFMDTIAEVYLPTLMTYIVNNGVETEDMSYILKIGLVMVGVALFAMATAVFGAYCSAKASIGLGSNLRQGVFDRVQTYSFSNIDKFTTGSLVTRLTNDITQVQNVTMMGLRLALRSPIMLIGAALMAIRLDSQLAMVLLIAVPILAIALAFIMTNGFKRFEVLQSMFDVLNSNVQENVTNVRVIKSFVREDYEKKKFAVSNEKLKNASVRAFSLIVIDMPIMTLVMNVSTILIIWIGGNKIMNGAMEVATLMAFVTYTIQILISLMLLSMVIIFGSRAIVSARRIVEVLDEEVDLKDSDEAIRNQYEIRSGQINFQNVAFKYKDSSSEKVLENIDFEIKSGQIFAIIGATGSAKSSLVQLIPRLYDCTEGEVIIDGRNVKDYTLKHLRDAVGMVLQKNVLFSGTIRENLRWGDENATDEEIIEAAKAAQAHSFISAMPNGYDTYLEQGGVNVSGGQKQRLCIARALLKKPKILILDDSTSAVDTATEAEIRKTFATSLKDTTKIIIAQRITSVMDADQILILDEGKVVDIGTHDELLAHSEAYQEIYYSQKEREVTA